jgi:hypothetical protein
MATVTVDGMVVSLEKRLVHNWAEQMVTRKVEYLVYSMAMLSVAVTVVVMDPMWEESTAVLSVDHLDESWDSKRVAMSVENWDTLTDDTMVDNLVESSDMMKDSGLELWTVAKKVDLSGQWRVWKMVDEMASLLVETTVVTMGIR